MPGRIWEGENRRGPRAEAASSRGTSTSHLCSLNTEFSRTIFSRSSISSLGRSAVIKAFTVTETSSGSWVSDRAVCTT